jgi:hypothetical protein
VVANSWKDSEDKLMPVKQWLDERRVMQVIRTHYESLGDKYFAFQIYCVEISFADHDVYRRIYRLLIHT